LDFCKSLYLQNIDAGKVTTYTVSNLTDGLNYYFVATAYDTSGNESGYSNEVSKTIPSTQQYTLTVTKAGTGTGIVTSSPAGINCGSDCSEAYNSGTVVTLTATADTSSTFAGWSGGCTGTGTCAVTMDAAKAVTATFTLKTYTITASAGTGGSISPSGSVTVNHGANQTFTITANSGYSLANVLVDGNPAGAVTTYPFTNVTANHVISVSFGMSDSDKDGVPDLEEFGPYSDNPNYDGNSDSIADYMQDNVVSLYTYDRNSYITMYTIDGQAFKNVTTISVPAGAPQGVNFPYQLVEFMIAQGSSAAVVIKLPAGTTMDQYYKYGPTPANPTAHWYNFMFDGQTGAEISGDIITLHFIDGLRGDDDITANGQIFDQGGPVTISNGVPASGQTVSYAFGDDGHIQSGIEWPAPRFTGNGDGTVTDNLTGLMWLMDGGCIGNNWYALSATLANFNSASGSYNCLGWYAGSYSDWRLPNVKELESLINYGASNSAAWLNSAGFKNVTPNYYWSSTTDQGKTSKAWSVLMSDGREISNLKSYSYHIMPVRTAASGNPYELPKTGQTVSYAPGDDGYLRSGIEWPGPRFTDNGDGTVTDDLTGLTWLKDGGCLRKNWSYALQAIEDINANPGNYNCLEYAGNYSDWRLPNVKELESLINYGAKNPAAWLNSEGFVNVWSYYYWSSTTFPGSNQAWSIDMTKGNLTPVKKGSSYNVWPVRGGNVGGSQ
jgi:hypothetical protein